MKSLNRVFLMGHLGGAPELQTSKGGKPYARLRLATNRSQRREDGSYEDKAEWHSVFVWGDQAERCTRWLNKGALVFVEGALSYWQVALDGVGETAEKIGYKNAIHADNIRFITYGRNSESLSDMENLDNPPPSRNHNAVAHPVM